MAGSRDIFTIPTMYQWLDTPLFLLPVTSLWGYPISWHLADSHYVHENWKIELCIWLIIQLCNHLGGPWHPVLQTAYMHRNFGDRPRLVMSPPLTPVLTHFSNRLRISFSAVPHCLCLNRPPPCSWTSSDPWDIQFHQLRLSCSLSLCYIWMFISSQVLRPSPLTGSRPCEIYSTQPQQLRFSHFGAW